MSTLPRPLQAFKMSVQTVKSVAVLRRTISDIEGDNEAFLEEAGIDTDEEEEETFMPVAKNANNAANVAQESNADDAVAKIPSIVVEDDHHQWETIETVVLNSQDGDANDVDVDAGVILDDGVKKTSQIQNARRQRRFRVFYDDDDDDGTSCFNGFWQNVEALLIHFRCCKFFKSLNVANVCDRLDEVSRKFFPIMFLLINFVYWVSYLYIL